MNVPMFAQHDIDDLMRLRETAISEAMEETVSHLGLGFVRALSWFPSNEGYVD